MDALRDYEQSHSEEQSMRPFTRRLLELYIGVWDAGSAEVGRDQSTFTETHVVVDGSEGNRILKVKLSNVGGNLDPIYELGYIVLDNGDTDREIDMVIKVRDLPTLDLEGDPFAEPIVRSFDLFLQKQVA